MSAEEHSTEQPIEQVLVTSAHTYRGKKNSSNYATLSYFWALPRLVSRLVQKNMHCDYCNLRVFLRGASKFLISVILPLQIRDDLVDTASHVEDCCTVSVCTLLAGLPYWPMILIMQEVEEVSHTVHKQGT